MDLIRQAKISKKLNSEKFNQLKSAAEQMEWFDQFYELHGNPTVRLIGSKQSVLSIRDLEGLQRRLKAFHFKVVRMRRENVVKAAISQIRAEQYAKKTLTETGKARWAIRKGEATLGSSHIEPELLVRRIGIMSSQQIRMMSAFDGLPRFDIEYEQVNQQLDTILCGLFEFLGLPSSRFEVPFIKSTPDDLKPAISNYDEVASTVALAGYKEYL